MSSNITTLLFDLDGTLIDTNELIIQSFMYTLGQFYPNKYKREDILPFIGPPLTETFATINPDKVDEMVKVYRKFNNSRHDFYIREFEGVYETIETLHKNGYKLGIVTTKIRYTVEKGLKASRLEPFFNVVVTLDDVEKTKPDPEPVFKALDQLRSSPEETIMIGDNHHDILAGKNAGTKTAGVAWSIKGSGYLAEYDPDYMLENLRDLLPIVGVEQK